jgi:hypothetical protein
VANPTAAKRNVETITVELPLKDAGMATSSWLDLVGAILATFCDANQCCGARPNPPQGSRDAVRRLKKKIDHVPMR